MARRLAYFLTLLTGFSALVYEVAWHKYLAALLGSHGEATAAILGIFLGGLALGYGALGRLAERCRGDRATLLRRYGGIEAGIGIYALGFPALFGICQKISLWIPVENPALAFAFDASLASLLIGPPAVLMGGTIPFLTQAFARDRDHATRIHAHIYAYNTAGAFAGALAGGFFLVPWLGLAGSIWCMAALNLAVGGLFVALSRSSGDSRSETEVGPPDHVAFGSDTTYILVAALSGFAFMCLQTTANRIGALALGGSPFTFAMVVAAFVLCIALGSFAVSALPRISAAWIVGSQWSLVAVLLAAYPFVDDAPYWAHRLRIAFESGTGDFYAYHASVFGALLLLSFPALTIGGATLPLLFHQARRDFGQLGRTAGRLYSWNTVGSLLGALLGGYALLFWLDLHHIYRIAVSALLCGATLLTLRLFAGSRWVAIATGSLVAVAVFALPGWSPQQLSMGLFRFRAPLPHSLGGPNAFYEQHARKWSKLEILHYDDGPTSSTAAKEMLHHDGTRERSIYSNGKSDGAIPVDNLTTGLLALLPAMLAEDPSRAFVIGFGTGHSVGELAALDSVQEVVVAEISSGVIAAAPLFEAGNRHAFSHPKSRVIRSDAYRALLRSAGTFDVIVSEPSNPWMAGIEMLYSREFLSAARERLSPGGVYAQWFHAYETDDATVALVLRTFLEAFGDAAVWYGWGTDYIMLGFRDRAPDDAFARLQRRFAQPDFRHQLGAFYLDSLPKLLAHEILPAGAIPRNHLPGPVHTLAFPRLNHRAARAFFAGGRGALPAAPDLSSPQRALLHQARENLDGEPLEEFRLDVLREVCNHNLTLCATLFAQWQSESPESVRLAETLRRARSDAQLASVLDARRLSQLAVLFGPNTDAARGLFESPESARATYRAHFHFAAPFHSSWTTPPGPTPLARN